MKKCLLLFATAIVAAYGSAQVTGYTVGQTVSDFTVTDTDGNAHSLYQITATGKYVVLDFFFDTCPPCQATQPYFNQLHDAYGCNEGDLFVISINNGTDNDAEVIAFENTFGGSFSHSPAVSSQGGSGAVTSAFGIAAYPTYCLIGPDNTLANSDIWPINDMSTFVAAFPVGSNIQPMACSSSVAQTNQDIALSIYPVPAQDQLNVMISGDGGIKFLIIDMSGRRVGEGSLTIGLTNIDISGLTAGHYLLQTTSGENSHRTAFSVVR